MKRLFATIIAVWSSRKLWVAVTAGVAIFLAFERTVNHLYSIDQPEKVQALVTMFMATIDALKWIALWFVGVLAASTFKSTPGAAAQVIHSLFAKPEQPKPKEWTE
jgi:hypothetical protein